MNLKRRSFMIILVILLIAIAAVVVYETIGKAGAKGRPPQPSAAQLQSWQDPVNQITTNLQGSSIIQVSFTLQAPNPRVDAELQARSAQVDDAIIGVLHNLSSSDIEQPGGRELLKKEIMDRINSFMTSGKIIAVYIDSLIVQ